MIKKVKLRKNQEIYFKEEIKGRVFVKVLSGDCEFWGTRIPVKKEIEINPPSLLYSISDAELELSISSNFVVQDTKEYYSDLFTSLSQYFKTSSHVGSERVMVIGNTDTGKSSFCKLLVNHYLEVFKKKEFQYFIDCDVGQNDFFSGCLSISKIPRNTFSQNTKKEDDCVFFYGHNTPSTNISLYHNYIRRINGMMDNDNQGFIMNTCGWVTGLGLKIILKMISILKIDLIVVLENEKLTKIMKEKQFGSCKPQILHFKKNKNVKKRSKLKRKNARIDQIKSYFNGKDGNAKVFKFEKSFSEINIYKMERNKSPNAVLPIGKKKNFSSLLARKLDLTKNNVIDGLKNAVLAISHGKEQNEILNSNIKGFVYVYSIDQEKQKFSLVSINRNIKSENFVLGTIFY